MDIKRILIVAAFGLAVAACGGRSNTLPATSPVDDVPPDSASSSGTSGARGLGGSAIDDDRMSGSGYPEDLIVYFEFDRSDVQAQYTDQLAAQARFLAGNPNVRVRLEGHADERGSREYNIGLGERRAQAVRRILLIQGASAGQISTVSYGEERPANPGSSEAAYAENRRVELVYRN